MRAGFALAPCRAKRPIGARQIIASLSSSKVPIASPAGEGYGLRWAERLTVRLGADSAARKRSTVRSNATRLAAPARDPRIGATMGGIA